MRGVPRASRAAPSSAPCRRGLAEPAAEVQRGQRSDCTLLVRVASRTVVCAPQEAGSSWRPGPRLSCVCVPRGAWHRGLTGRAAPASGYYAEVSLGRASVSWAAPQPSLPSPRSSVCLPLGGGGWYSALSGALSGASSKGLWNTGL